MLGTSRQRCYRIIVTPGVQGRDNPAARLRSFATNTAAIYEHNAGSAFQKLACNKQAGNTGATDKKIYQKPTHSYWIC